MAQRSPLVAEARSPLGWKKLGLEQSLGTRLVTCDQWRRGCLAASYAPCAARFDRLFSHERGTLHVCLSFEQQQVALATSALWPIPRLQAIAASSLVAVKHFPSVFDRKREAAARAARRAGVSVEPLMPAPEWVPISTFAMREGVTTSTIYGRIKAGILVASRHDGRIMLLSDALGGHPPPRPLRQKFKSAPRISLDAVTKMPVACDRIIPAPSTIGAAFRDDLDCGDRQIIGDALLLDNSCHAQGPLIIVFPESGCASCRRLYTR
jgi:hypothetical protein